MNKFQLVIDGSNNSAYGVIATIANADKYIGNMSHGADWAKWAGKSGFRKLEIIESLDMHLSLGDVIPLSSDEVLKLKSLLSDSAFGALSNFVEQNLLLTKNNPEPENLIEDDEPEYELVADWPITDIALSLIEVQFKMNAVHYKAKSFISDSSASSFSLSTKGVRAMWDPNFPGGGRWRCPPESGYTAGQFTNRFGRGCLPGAARRIGRRMLSLADAGVLKRTLGDRGGILEARGFLRDERGLAAAGRRSANRIERQGRRTERRIAGLAKDTDDLNNPNPQRPAANRSERRKKRGNRLAAFADRLTGERVTPRNNQANQPDNLADESPVTVSTARMNRRINNSAKPLELEPGTVLTDERNTTDQLLLDQGFAEIERSLDEIEQSLDDNKLRRKRRSKTPVRPHIIDRISKRRQDGRLRISDVRPRVRETRGPDNIGPRETMRERAALRLERLAQRLTARNNRTVTPNTTIQSPEPAVNSQLGQRARMRQVVLSKDSPRRVLYGNIIPSQRTARNLKGWEAYTAIEQQSLEASATKAQKRLTDGWRTRLGLSPADNLDEDAIDTWMKALTVRQPRKAAVLQNQAHNAVILDDFLDPITSNTSKLKTENWAAIKPAMREWIIADAGLTAPARVSPKSRKTPVPNKPPQRPRLVRSGGQLALPPGPAPTQGNLVPDADVVDDELVFDTQPEPNNELAPVGVDVVTSTNEHGTIDAAENALFIYEENTKLYRDPISGMYKEDYKDLPITIDTEVNTMQPLPLMQRKKKNGAIVSYPKIRNHQGFVGGKAVIVQLSLAPNTTRPGEGHSVSTWAEARGAIWNDLPESVKRENPGIEIVEIPRINGVQQTADTVSSFNSSRRSSYRNSTEMAGTDISTQDVFLRTRTSSWNFGHTDVAMVISSVNTALVSNQPQDWMKAWAKLKSVHADATRKLEASLTEWRRPDNKNNSRQRREFVLAGDLAETVEAIIERVMPSVFPIIISGARSEMEESAKLRNKLAVRRTRAQSEGLRIVGGVDPAILFPPKSADGVYINRTPAEIDALYEKNRAFGYFEQLPLVLNPGESYVATELNDSQIDFMDTVQKARDASHDYRTGLALEDAHQQRAQHLATLGQSGFNDLPVQVTLEEMELLLKTLDSEGQPMYIPIVRGISRRGNDDRSPREMAQEYISGDRFITAGQGGSAGGEGDNFSTASNPIGGYDPGDEARGSILALIPRSSRLSTTQEVEKIATHVRDIHKFINRSINHPSEHVQPSGVSERYETDPSAGRRTAWENLYPNETARPNMPAIVEWDDFDGLHALQKAVMVAILSDGMHLADSSEFSFSVYDNPRDDFPSASEPIGGLEWFKNTRAEIVGWYIQLEIKRNALLASGAETSEQQQAISRLVNAQTYLNFLTDEVTMSPILGYDAYLSGGGNSFSIDKDPRRLFLSMFPGKYGMYNHVMVVNRSALIVLDSPISLASAMEFMDSFGVIMPNGETMHIYKSR